MNIATWNVNSLNVRLPQVIDWLQLHQPDVLVLQELKLETDKFPLAAIEAAGYRAAVNGQKTYNGVAILSRHPLTDIAADLPGFDDVQKRVLAATVNGIRIINVYCVNGEAVGSDKYAYKQRWFAALRDHVAAELARHPELVLLGDFNIAPADLDVYDPEKWHEKILCSSAERQWFADLLSLGLTDSLRHLDAEQPHYTWWDYRMNMFRRKLGLRIDHILVSHPLRERLQQVTVDTAARAWERPSDHAPVMARLR